VNPENPASTTDFVCDVCTEIPEPTDGGRSYAFTIREDVKFQDGSRLTADDVAASWSRIIAPPEGVISARSAYYSMIDKLETPDPQTVIFHLKFATAAFLPALADPYAFIYKKELLDRDQHWFEKQIMGSGPFRFKRISGGAIDFRHPQSRLLPPGFALSRGFHRDFRRQASGSRERDPG
jgi:peptide/nickel transport system substrate-binding protein